MQEGFRQSLEALYRRSQRESNAHASYGYAQLLMSLIQEWRALFKRPELPFIFAQLPNRTLEPDCDWPRLRDKQRRALTLLEHGDGGHGTGRASGAVKWSFSSVLKPARNRACEWRSERALPSTVSVCRPMKHR